MTDMDRSVQVYRWPACVSHAGWAGATAAASREQLGDGGAHVPAHVLAAPLCLLALVAQQLDAALHDDVLDVRLAPRSEAAPPPLRQLEVRPAKMLPQQGGAAQPAEAM